jgi:hypothetical protein
MSKIFVRERRHVGEGAGRPRFAIVASQCDDLQFYHTFVRRAELEKLAQELGAEIVYLPRGEQADGPESRGRTGQRQHRRSEPAEE